jgi:hypothetical protein
MEGSTTYGQRMMAVVSNALMIAMVPAGVAQAGTTARPNSDFAAAQRTISFDYANLDVPIAGVAGGHDHPGPPCRCPRPVRRARLVSRCAGQSLRQLPCAA